MRLHCRPTKAAVVICSVHSFINRNLNHLFEKRLTLIKVFRLNDVILRPIEKVTGWIWQNHEKRPPRSSLFSSGVCLAVAVVSCVNNINKQCPGNSNTPGITPITQPFYIVHCSRLVCSEVCIALPIAPLCPVRQSRCARSAPSWRVIC